MAGSRKERTAALTRRESIQLTGLALLGAGVAVPAEALAADDKVLLRFYEDVGGKKKLLQVFELPANATKAIQHGQVDAVKLVWSFRRGKKTKRLPPRPLPGHAEIKKNLSALKAKRRPAKKKRR